eukprot:CAMPEP_0185452124 /NCGR_PEP_ID=MMETSP1365-20130426/66371_1 /TAXON_ID=38817 /ORGANISM="Gephyrocapsa oceanica, Strain RCC1303" /LENGTH=354 /DNA_ID=CAMNT_0028058303 /DNA_START=167 /DNA_END=1228 /DNA_ORIENTATION=-
MRTDESRRDGSVRRAAHGRAPTLPSSTPAASPHNSSKRPRPARPSPAPTPILLPGGTQRTARGRAEASPSGRAAGRERGAAPHVQGRAGGSPRAPVRDPAQPILRGRRRCGASPPRQPRGWPSRGPEELDVAAAHVRVVEADQRATRLLDRCEAHVPVPSLRPELDPPRGDAVPLEEGAHIRFRRVEGHPAQPERVGAAARGGDGRVARRGRPSARPRRELLCAEKLDVARASARCAHPLPVESHRRLRVVVGAKLDVRLARRPPARVAPDRDASRGDAQPREEVGDLLLARRVRQPAHLDDNRAAAAVAAWRHRARAVADPSLPAAEPGRAARTEPDPPVPFPATATAAATAA